MHLPTTPEKRTWTDGIGLHIPIGILLAIYLTSNWIQLDALSQKHQQLVVAEKQLSRDDVKRQLGNAELATSKLEALVKEIIALAPSDPNALRIAEEFHLPLSATAEVPAAPAKPAGDTKIDTQKTAAPSSAGKPVTASNDPAPKH